MKKLSERKMREVIGGKRCGVQFVVNGFQIRKIFGNTMLCMNTDVGINLK